MSLLYRSYLNRRPLAKHLLLGIALFNAPGIAVCAEWSLKSSIDQFLGYDTNVRMQEKAQGSFLYKIIPVLTLVHRTDVSEIKADAMYGTQIYTDIVGLDQDIQNYGLSGTYKTERIDWSLALNHSSTPSRNNATQSSGNFGATSINTTQSISPTLTFRLDEIDSLILAHTYSQTSFSNSSADNFRNYNTNNISLAWERTWSERYSSSVSTFYSIFESQTPITLAQPSSNFDSYGINFSNNYLWTEKWKLAGTIGVRQTESKTGSTTSSSVGFLADIGADYTGDNFNSGINFNRSLSPSNQGRLQEQTGISWNINYKITERLSSNFNIYYLESTQVNQINQSTRKNIIIEPGISWQMAPEWTLSGSYRYRTQDSNQDDFGNITGNRSAESNLLMLTLKYNWQGLSISR